MQYKIDVAIILYFLLKRARWYRFIDLRDILTTHASNAFSYRPIWMRRRRSKLPSTKLVGAQSDHDGRYYFQPQRSEPLATNTSRYTSIYSASNTYTSYIIHGTFANRQTRQTSITIHQPDSHKSQSSIGNMMPTHRPEVYKHILLSGELQKRHIWLSASYHAQ